MCLPSPPSGGSRAMGWTRLPSRISWASTAATNHLLSLGHRRIGYIGGDVHHSSNQARWQGYQAALREHHLPVAEELVRLGVLRNTWGSVATANPDAPCRSPHRPLRGQHRV